MSRVAQIKLNSGHTIPHLGFGTWQAPDAEVETAVYEAVKAGYRHLDLAKVYGNQKAVAKGIARAGVPREELFITSKLWNSSHRPDLVEAALDDTLADLGMDYLDLYLVHWPVAFVPTSNPTVDRFPKTEDGTEVLIDEETSVVDTWKAVTELVKTGKVKSVGVSNHSIEAIEALSKATGVVPAVHQVERHPLLLQEDLVKHHAEKGIHITAYSLLGNNNVGIPLLIENETIKSIAEKIGATPAQVLIAWGSVGNHSVIPKSVTPSRIQSNFQEVTLSDEDVEKINALGKGEGRKRYNIPFNYKPRWNVNVFGEPEEKDAKYEVKIGA